MDISKYLTNKDVSISNDDIDRCIKEFMEGE